MLSQIEQVAYLTRILCIQLANTNWVDAIEPVSRLAIVKFKDLKIYSTDSIRIHHITNQIMITRETKSGQTNNSFLLTIF